jgi:hypothetical protein
MTEVRQLATQQWASRPADERFVSLPEMLAKLTADRNRSDEWRANVNAVTVAPNGRNDITVSVDGGKRLFQPTHWSFGQLVGLGKTPADYMRELGRKGGSEMVADCVNFGLRFMRDRDEIGVLAMQRDGQEIGELQATTGPDYGRVWNHQIVSALIERFGDGVTGDFKVPGEFGKDVAITRNNTTLYASDRDMFVFLADEKNRIEIPNRRNGKAGSLARGFYVWNSQVGSKKLGLATFLFDFACSNRTIWGGEQYAEIEIRHSAGAPDRWLQEMQPALVTYSQGSSSTIVDAVKAAQAAKIEEDVEKFMATRFGKQAGATMRSTHELEEGRPVETLWDASVAATAFARTIEHQDKRVAVERQAGDLIKLAA